MKPTYYFEIMFPFLLKNIIKRFNNSTVKTLKLTH